MLTIQYRMWPSIRQFPGNQFYDGLITDHESILKRALPPHLVNIEKFFKSRMVFIDVQDTMETNNGMSKCNKYEAEFTKRLVEVLATLSTSQRGLKALAGSIGVISPYKA